MKELFIDGELWQEALDFFGSKEKALRWFRQPLPSLGDEPPGEYCTSHYSGDKKVRSILQQLKAKARDDSISDKDKGKGKNHARELAYANVRLEGYILTEEFKDVYEQFADNKISLLEAYELLNIDIAQIPPETRARLALSYKKNWEKKNP